MRFRTWVVARLWDPKVKPEYQTANVVSNRKDGNAERDTTLTRLNFWVDHRPPVKI